MDVLTHSLLGLTAAKAGLERYSPYTAAVCILSANAPDIDVASALFGDRWTVLLHHRGITHSIAGTLMLGVLIPSVFWGIERVIAKWRKRPPQIRYRGLLFVSLIVAATHPLMDWTNNYGLRPLLPWSGRWFYGDLVFIVDPYIWLALGGAAFLLTSNRRWKTVAWSVLGLGLTLLFFLAPTERAPGPVNLTVIRTIWLAAILSIIVARVLRLERRLGKSIAALALIFVVCYWGALALAHHTAYRESVRLGNQLSIDRGEHFITAAAMPTVGNPFRWQGFAETDRATYRFFVGVGPEALPTDPREVLTDGKKTNSLTKIERYEKPSGRSEELVLLAERDRRAQILLGFARFPIARVENDNCIGQTLVQFADLRYTEPGIARGNFSVNIPVECPAP